jgi:FSR family fosmidomycin resistance protein-like MFS transporter
VKQEQNKELKENKKATGWLTAGHGLTDCYSGFINPILPFITEKIGVTLAFATLALSISQVFSSIMQPVFGFIADKWRKRFFIFWGMLFASTFLSLTGFVQNFWQLALCLVAGGIGVGFYHPQATGLIVRYSGENTAKSMSIFIAAGTVGYSLGPVVSSGIIQCFGLEKLYMAAVFGILFAFSVFLFVPKVAEANFVKNEQSFKKSLSEILKNSTMRLLIMVSSLKSLVTSSFCVLMPFWWKNAGYKAFEIGIAMFFFLTVGAAATYLSTYLEKFTGYKKVFYISLTVPFFLTLLFVYLVKLHPFLSFVFFIMIGFSAMLSVSVNMVLAQREMPEYRGMISGFIGGFSWGIVGVFLPLIGFAAQKFGILQTLLFISGIPFVMSYFLKYLPEETTN